MQKLFPIADRQFLHTSFGISWKETKGCKAVFAKRKDKPKKGEWFLSGNPIEAYYARCDLDTVYHIAQIVKVEQVSYYKIIERL